MSKYEFNHFGRCYRPIENFDEAKARYESIHPIRGKRYPLDIRPVGARYRWGERIIRVSKNEYAIGTAWSISMPFIQLAFKRSGEIVVSNFNRWPSGASTPENFVSQHLPADLYSIRYSSKIYLVVPDGDGGKNYYYLSKKPLRIKKVDGRWHVLNPVQEYKYKISRKITKKLYKPLVELDEYLSTMWDMVDDEDVRKAETIWAGSIQWLDRLRSREEWWSYLLSLKEDSGKYHWAYGKGVYVYGKYSSSMLNRLKRHICRANIRKFTKEPVPIGVPCTTHRALGR